jgi:hypothetical protein
VTWVPYADAGGEELMPGRPIEPSSGVRALLCRACGILIEQGIGRKEGPGVGRCANLFTQTKISGLINSVIDSTHRSTI